MPKHRVVLPSLGVARMQLPPLLQQNPPHCVTRQGRSCPPGYFSVRFDAVIHLSIKLAHIFAPQVFSSSSSSSSSSSFSFSPSINLFLLKNSFLGSESNHPLHPPRRPTNSTKARSLPSKVRLHGSVSKVTSSAECWHTPPHPTEPLHPSPAPSSTPVP
ncbi:hypothetical protein EJ06DRAFT_381770 [Trichodelitschia bisporula]|uniref:Uncharacterized protein n=1 Tax=Trichodelitschia bisporula TaxID=703511 RepID=A0A6G1HZF1_9PEZI|nr:hypothetical protein EJ06DRAFT_381770 [Trichodelitschia bisporula]